MTDTINVPGMGATKKTTVYVAGGIGAVIIGVVWYRSRSTASSTPVDTTQVDPATGYPYGSAEDAAALQSQSSYISPGGSGTGSSDPYYGAQQPTGYTSNSQWAQAAEDYLGNTVGSDTNTVAAALGKYLTGGNVTEDQRTIIQQAIGFQGYPPVSGPDGYPPSIRVLAAPPPSAKSVSNGYYRDMSAGGAIYKVDANKYYHVQPSYWAKLKPKPALHSVAAGWAGRVGIPYAGELR